MYSCVNLWKSPDEQEQMEDVVYWVKSERYAPGFNPDMGDKNIVLRDFPFMPSDVESVERANQWFFNTRASRTRFWWHDYAGE